MRLNSNEVEQIFLDSLCGEGRDIPEPLVVEGITAKFGFDKEKVLKHKTQIEEMLYDLPLAFREEEGGGYSFLEACCNKDGEQWTGLHKIMELLFVLGMAIGRVKTLLPRELWAVLPGGVPYYVITKE